MKRFAYIMILSLLISCYGCANDKQNNRGEIITDPEPTAFYLGADLSYVNEMLDCGAEYKNSEGTTAEPYKLFADYGCNLVRLRLWHNPDWTNYSNYNDIKLAIQRAKKEGMKVLLDFHYSDTWADPDHQQIPKAWEQVAGNTAALGDSIYNYTYTILMDLNKHKLLPELVQVGNETNSMIAQAEPYTSKIDWNRNAALFQKGMKAVRDAEAASGKDIGLMLHIAQPENGLWWFKEASENGIKDYDWIGLSYYPKWSEYKFHNLSDALTELISTYQKKLMIVETSYPFSLDNKDEANNILGADSLLEGFPATQQGQLDYLINLTTIVKNAGAHGIVYWEPAWVSTNCSTRWGKGSHWDNATLFDHDNKPTLGMTFYQNQP